MKKSFVTGLVILLPVAVTFSIVGFLIHLLTRPFENFVREILIYSGMDWSTTFLTWISQILILVTILVLLMLVGMLAQFLAARTLIKYGDVLLHNIPFVNKIYMALQEVTRNFFKAEETPYQSVVLIPFHLTEVLCIGFVTNKLNVQKECYSVFVPATPNPMMGFMLLIPREEVTFLDMKVEDALKMIISCGALSSELREV